MNLFSWWLIEWASEKTKTKTYKRSCDSQSSREVWMIQAMSVMCHIKLSHGNKCLFQGGSSVKAKCSQDSTDKQGTMSKWERFVESQKQVWVTGEVPKILLQPSPWWPGVSFLGPRFFLFPYSWAVLLSNAGLLCKLCRLMQNEGPGCLVLISPSELPSH